MSFVECDEADAVFAGDGGGDEGIAADDFEAEAAGAAGDFKSDAAEAEDAESLAAQLRALQTLLFPLAGVHGGVGGGELAGQREHEADGELGDGDGVGAGRVHDDDAAARGGFGIDVVDAYAGAANDAQFGRVLHQRVVDLHGGADDESIGIGECGGQAVGELVVRENFPAGFGCKNGQGCGRNFFRQNDLHLVSLGRCGGPVSNSSKRMLCCSQSRSNMRTTAACGLPSPRSYLVMELGCTPSCSAIWYGVEIELLARDEKLFAEGESSGMSSS